jgi:drug/metabolite transporter (DMT)-like permease
VTGSARGNVLAALVASFLWATAYIGPSAVKPANELLLVTGRYTLFGLCGLYVLWRGWPDVRRMSVRRMLFGWHLGVVGYLVFYICVAYAVTLGSGFITAIVVGSSPIAIAIVGNFVEKRVSWRALAPSIILIFAGIFLVSAQDFARGEGSAGDSLAAVGLALIASLVWAYFVVVNAQSQRTWADKPDPKYWSALVAVGAGSGSVLILPFAVATTPAGTWQPGPLFTLVMWCVFLGVLGSWYGTFIWVRAARGIPATMAGPLLATEAIFGALLSLGWERRIPTWAETAGCLCILAGVALFMFLDLRRNNPREEEPCATPSTWSSDRTSSSTTLPA